MYLYYSRKTKTMFQVEQFTFYAQIAMP